MDPGRPVRHEGAGRPHTHWPGAQRDRPVGVSTCRGRRCCNHAKPCGLKQAHNSLLGLELGSQGVDKLPSEASSEKPSTPW